MIEIMIADIVVIISIGGTTRSRAINEHTNDDYRSHLDYLVALYLVIQFS